MGRALCLLIIAIAWLVAVTSSAANLNATLQAIPQNTLVFAEQASKSQRQSPAKSQKQLLNNYLEHYFSPWLNPYLFHSRAHIKDMEAKIARAYTRKPGWGSNKQHHSQAWADKIVKNMQLNKYPNIKKPALTIEATNLRKLPTQEPSYKKWTLPGEGYPFDNLQVSLLHPNVPIYILHSSKNGAWKLVITANKAFGWVKSQDIAYVSKKFIRTWQTGHYVAATQGGIPVRGYNGRFYFLTRIGEIFPLYRNHRNSYQVMVATANSYGKAVIKTATINKKYAAQMPLSASAKNIATIANHLMANPYGWGALHGYRDCSTLTKDLFTPFSIWLPRNSKEQAHSGDFISFTGMSKQQKRTEIIDKGIPFHTLIWRPGHIMLYIGHKDGKIYVFHSPWGLETLNRKTGKEGRAIIGRAIVAPLSLGTKQKNIKRTELDRAEGMTILTTQKSVPEDR